MTVTHAKVSGKSDGGDSTLVLPSDWNAGHTVTGLVVVIADPGVAWAATTAKSLTNRIKVVDGTYGNLVYEVISAGTTGGTEPLWVDPVTINMYAFDGTVVWSFIGIVGGAAIAPLEGVLYAIMSGGINEITDHITADTTTTKVLAPDGAGGVAWRAEAGGLARSIVGYNTIGGSNAAWATDTTTCYATKITLAATSSIISIGAYIQMATIAGIAGAVVIYADSAGAPVGNPLSVGLFGGGAASASGIGVVFGATATPSWFEVPVGGTYAAGDYWVGILITYQGTNWKIYYDGSGSDKEITMSDATYIDGIGRASVASAGNKYSIRATILA